MQIGALPNHTLRILGMLLITMCQSVGEVPETKKSQSDTDSCSNCTIEHCAGAAVLRDGVLQVDRDQLRQRARCLGVHSEVQLHPKTEQGKLVGVALFSIRDGSLFQSMGLQNRDLITSVNGAPADLTSMLDLLGALGHDDAVIEIVVRRGAETMTLRFRIG